MTLPVGRKSVLEAVHASEQTPSGELEFKVLAVSSATELSGVSTAPVAGFLHVYVHTPGVFVSLGVWAHVLGACVALAWPKWTVWCAHTCHLHFRLFVLAPWVQDEGEHGGGDVDGPGTLCHCAALSILAVVQDFLDGVGGLGEGPPVRLVVGLPPRTPHPFSHFRSRCTCGMFVVTQNVPPVDQPSVRVQHGVWCERIDFHWQCSQDTTSSGDGESTSPQLPHPHPLSKASVITEKKCG
jgi:hypothetical protein